MVRFLDLVALPDSAAACRNLARALLGGEREVAAHVVRDVPVIELLKADAQLVVPAEIEVSADDELAELAGKIDLIRLEEVSDITAGAALSRTDTVDVLSNDALPIVRVTEVGDGVLRLGERYVRPDVRNRVRNAQLVRYGDVLLSVDGTIGKVLHVRTVLNTNREAVSESLAGPIAVAQKGLAILRPRGALDPRFLAAVLASKTLQAILRRLARGAVITHLPLSVLRGVRVPVPPPIIQERVLRRLAYQPGDALEALALVLAGQDEDPFSRLFREHPAVVKLTGEGLPEEAERGRASVEALRELRAFRNRAVHGQLVVADAVLQWLTMVGAVPVGAFVEQGGSAVLRFEAFMAAHALLSAALVPARAVGGLLGRQVVRLTERLVSWAQEAPAKAASDFTIKVEHVGHDVDWRGVGTAHLRVVLTGSVPLRKLVLRPDLPSEPLPIDELRPGDSVELDVSLPEALPWSGREFGMWLTRRMNWSGTRLDGVDCQGSEEFSIFVHHGELGAPLRAVEVAANSPADLGTSPYVTGDVVDDPGMFFGRQSVFGDIRTHLGGGTKVILLEGNRRTGKTSILRQLQRPEHGLINGWLPVECSFQGTVGDPTKDGIPTEGVFRLLVRDIGLACVRAGCPVPLPEMEPVTDLNTFRFRLARALNGFFASIDPYEALQIYVDMVAKAIAPRRLLLMLDEFDKLQVGIDNGITSPQVPENIRNLLQTRPAVAAILTGSRRLKRLREEYWSALFGFGHRIGVDPLEASEVRELVTRPVAGRLTFDDGALDTITALTARQPYLVQSLCARVFELAKRSGWRRIRRAEVQESAARMVRDNEHFQSLWSYAETERRRYLLWLCHRLADEPHRVNAALLTQRLEDAGVVVPVEHIDDDIKFLIELELVALSNTQLGPQYELAVPLMRRWMDENIDAEAQRRRAVHEAHGGIET